jgi:hypothetical protein
MQPGLFTTYDSRTLLVDANNEHGGQLVEQLNHAGLKTDFAVSWGAAHAALGANSYQSCIVVADLDQPACCRRPFQCRISPRDWLPSHSGQGQHFERRLETGWPAF